MSLRALIIGLALLSVTSCATVPNTSIENMQGDVPEGSGLVVAEALTNAERIVGPVRHWTEVVLWRLDYEGEDTTFSIESLSYSLSTQAFMGVVPAGKYRLGMLYAHLQLGEYGFSGRALAPPAMGTFEVKPGKVTNLGTILYQPFQERHFLENEYPDYAMTRVANEGLWQVAKLANPHIATQFSSQELPLTWDDDDSDDIRQSVARLMKEASFPAELHKMPDGKILATGKLGGVQQLDPDHLIRFYVDSQYKVIDATELPGGKILFGGELGLLGVLNTVDRTVQNISLGKARAHILDIEMGGANEPYISVFTPDGYDIHNYDSASGSLTLIKSLPKKKVGFIERGYIAYAEDLRHPILVGTPNGVAVYFEGSAYQYDEQSDEWSESESPEFIAIFRQQDGYLSGIPFSGWSGTMPPRFSSDNGSSWIETDEKGGLLKGWNDATYRFADGDLIRIGEDADITFWSGTEVLDEIPILLSQDNGASWEAVGSVPRGCVTLAAEVSTDELMLIHCTDGGLITSNDLGHTWRQYLAPMLPSFDEFPGELKVRYGDEKIKTTAPLPPIPVTQ